MRQQPKPYAQRERFLWSDLPDAAETIARMAKQLQTQADLLRGWAVDGYAILPATVAPQSIDGFLARAHSAIAQPNTAIQMTYWDTDGHHHEQVSPAHLGKTEAKVLDLHIHLDEAHDLVFAPNILRFLTDIFQDDAVAFQCLYFENGSQQGCHQDTAFVFVDPPYQFAASWIALEDIVPGSGELFYFPGSQMTDDLIFEGGTKALRGGDADAGHYSVLLEDIAAQTGLHKQFLHIKAGEALMWAADLMHGGAPIHTPHTRRSLVTHYCPLKAVVPYAEHLGRKPRRVRERGWVIGAN